MFVRHELFRHARVEDPMIWVSAVPLVAVSADMAVGAMPSSNPPPLD